LDSPIGVILSANKMQVRSAARPFLRFLASAPAWFFQPGQVRMSRPFPATSLPHMRYILIKRNSITAEKFRYNDEKDGILYG
jgi:hypothetical protein